jgi:hypothetical protein
MKVGDYVRTNVERLNIQQICKIKKILFDDFIFTDRGYYDKEYIIKSSPNIIDLIEVGDYVNGWKITTIDKRNNKLYAEYDDGYLIQTISKKNIKSIVTKEQFESMQYNLESEVN